MREHLNIPKNAKMPKLVGKVHSLGALQNYKYVAVVAFYKGKLLLSRHKQRETWQTQGGHIESGETTLEAAKRKLFEESGATEFTIQPVGDYEADGIAGVFFAAEVTHIGDLPEDSEIAEVKSVDFLPANLTYQGLTPMLYRKVRELRSKSK